MMNYTFIQPHKYARHAPLVPVRASVGIRGEFRAVLTNADGSVAHDSGWNSNVITANGLSIYGYKTWYSSCCIGSDATPASSGDSSIGALLGDHDTVTNPDPEIDYPRPPVGPDYERYSTKKFRFDPGTGTGTVAEFTLGTTTSGTDIFCRHVLPVAIPKAIDQALDVYYRIYVKPNITPLIGTVSLNGNTYDWETSFCDMDAYNNDLFTPQGFSVPSYTVVKAYDGAKGSATGLPTGNTAFGGSIAYQSRGSGWEQYKLTVALDWCNTATDEITVLTIPTATGHTVQCTFDFGGNGIPKDNTMILTLDWKMSWSAYTP